MKQEMSQTCDECPQRNWSSIRHLRKVSCNIGDMLQTQNLEMRPDANVNAKVTKNGMHHSAIPREINTLNLGFLHQII